MARGTALGRERVILVPGSHLVQSPLGQEKLNDELLAVRWTFFIIPKVRYYIFELLVKTRTRASKTKTMA